MPRPEFNTYYSELYPGRWTELSEALNKKEKQVARYNRFCDSGERFHENVVPWLRDCYWHETFQEIPRNEKGLLSYYVMDPASVLAARALEVQEADNVLDMCAAPGGKTLILAETLGGGSLIANEPSNDRRERLTKVIQQYIPRERRENVWVKGKEGYKYGLEMPEEFDKVLVDAPCSGERHLLANPEELANWSKKRTERLAQQQYALVAAALLALRPGGSLLYSTCSLSHLENDGVIAKLIKKKSGFEIVKMASPSPVAEETEFGWIHLPDRSIDGGTGFGPLYFAKILKT